MKPTQEQVIAWAKEVSGVEFPAGIAGVKIGMSPEHLESVATLAYEAGRKDEVNRIVNLIMIQHEAAKERHNYWHCAANLIQAEVASDT